MEEANVVSSKWKVQLLEQILMYYVNDVFVAMQLIFC